MKQSDELQVDLDVRSGGGLWSTRVTDVKVTKLAWYARGDETFVEAYFDPATWDVRRDGLLYTDMTFKKNLKKAIAALVNEGRLPKELPWSLMSYTEQGMQDRAYVHMILGGW